MDKTLKPKKLFGTFEGVFIPSAEAIIGAVIFLLLPGLTAEMGLIRMLMIVLLAHTLTLSTAASLSSCVTNLNNVGDGGMYAIARRSLGKAFSGSIGIQLYIAQTVSVAFYCIGFIEPIYGILSNIPAYQQIMGIFSIAVQKQLLASVVITIFFFIALVGANFIIKIQMVILVTLSLSILAVYISPLFNNIFNFSFNNIPVFLQNGLNLSGMNMYNTSFFGALLIFFPAVTGISTGIGMSGELKTPKKSIVRGTFAAILITMAVYTGITIVYSTMNPAIFKSSIGGYNSVLDVLNVLPFSIFIIAGILFATSSSGLGLLMTAPRTLFAVTNNNVLPKFMSIFGRDFIKGGKEPRFATILTYLLAVSVVWVGDLKLISSIVGICFLVVHSWLNFAAFLEKVSKNPSFRPTFKANAFISLYGFVASIVVISLFDVLIGLLVLVVQFGIFLLILKFKSENKLEGVWWGIIFTLSDWLMKKLSTIIQGTKNWRPTVIIFKNYDKTQPYTQIIEMGEMLSNYGMVSLNILNLSTQNNIVNFKSKLPYQVIKVEREKYTDVVTSITQVRHIGGIECNSVLMEYDDGIDWINVLSEIISHKKNIMLFKNGIASQYVNRVDLYWRGEANGNLMALISYILYNSLKTSKNSSNTEFRIIRKVETNEDEESANNELKNLIEKSRLPCKIKILPYDNIPFDETIMELSFDAKLIIMGLPGITQVKNEKEMFIPSKVFFEDKIKKYEKLPPILFVKASGALNLIEEDE